MGARDKGAGIVGAIVDNGEDNAGIAWNSKILAVKIFSDAQNFQQAAKNAQLASSD
jgi:hypothetical protein